jgi:predicted alpha/beta superfamily hydrolase
MFDHASVLIRKQPFRDPTTLSMLLTVAFVSLATLTAAATPFTLNGTEVRTLPHSANGRDYTLYIGLPSSYATSPTRRYPVLYACDGYWDFHLLMAESGNLTVDYAIPECIVVGISYAGTAPDYGSLRQWDLTPGVDPYVGSNSGHASEFLSVIANEFIPFVEKEYRVDSSYRVLSGSSYGGLFTVYSMFEHMDLFQAYIAISPALWWRNQELLNRERLYASAHTALPARLYLTFAGDESTAIRDSTRTLGANLRQTNYSNLALAVREIDGERHSGTKGEGYNRGLRFAFAPLAPSPDHVINPGYRSRSPLINISSRARIGTGNDVLIAGFVVDGPEPRRVLIRGVGPSLVPQGVTNAISDPKITVFDFGQHVIATNDNWAEAPDQIELARATAQVGAFGLQAGSHDAALLITLNPGAYSVVVSGMDNSTGVGLAEVYEVLP